MKKIEYLRDGLIVISISGVDPATFDVLVDEIQINSYSSFESDRVVEPGDHGLEYPPLVGVGVESSG